MRHRILFKTLADLDTCMAFRPTYQALLSIQICIAAQSFLQPPGAQPLTSSNGVYFFGAVYSYSRSAPTWSRISRLFMMYLIAPYSRYVASVQHATTEINTSSIGMRATNLYAYTPLTTLAFASAGLFAILSFAHVILCIKWKSWFFFGMIIGTIRKT